MNKFVKFFATLDSDDQANILEFAHNALKDEGMKERMDTSDEYAEELAKKIEDFMIPMR
jgi:electron transfer flavoprotein alpha/beta subunit